MEQGTPGTIRRYFCSGNNKQGQSREALTYRKIQGDLQIEMFNKHFDISVVEWASLPSRTITLPIHAHHHSAHCLAAVASERMDSAMRSAVPIGISPTTVTMISAGGVVKRRETATVGPNWVRVSV